jgi:hypothetical protein
MVLRGLVLFALFGVSAAWAQEERGFFYQDRNGELRLSPHGVVGVHEPVRLRFNRDSEILNPLAIRVTSRPAVEWDAQVSDDGHYLNLRARGGFLASGEFYEIHVEASSMGSDGGFFWNGLRSVSGLVTGEGAFTWDMSLETRSAYLGPSDAEVRLAEGRSLHYALTTPHFLQVSTVPTAAVRTLTGSNYHMTIFRAGSSEGARVAVLALPEDRDPHSAFFMEGFVEGEGFRASAVPGSGVSGFDFEGRLAPDRTLAETSFSASGGAEGVMGNATFATDVVAQLVSCIDEISAQMRGALFWGDLALEVNISANERHLYGVAVFDEGRYVTSAFSDRPGAIRLRLRLRHSLNANSRVYVFRDGYIARLFTGSELTARMPLECEFPTE